MNDNFISDIDTITASKYLDLKVKTVAKANILKLIVLLQIFLVVSYRCFLIVHSSSLLLPLLSRFVYPIWLSDFCSIFLPFDHVKSPIIYLPTEKPLVIYAELEMKDLDKTISQVIYDWLSKEYYGLKKSPQLF